MYIDIIAIFGWDAKKGREFARPVDFVATRLGLEPRMRVPETLVLPITLPGSHAKSKY